MRNSQTVVVSVLGILTLIMIVMAGLGRVALSQLDSDTTRPEASSTTVEGEQITETFNLEDFHSINVDGAWRINLTQGDDWRVEVSHSEDLNDDLDVYLQGNRLVLDRRSSGGWRWWRRSGPRPSAEIVMPDLSDLNLAGASRLDFSGFDGGQLSLKVAGANQMEGRDGRYDSLNLTVAGASQIDLGGILVTDAQVDLAGASDVTLSMNGGDLAGSMAGAGGISYYGTVAEETVKVAGIARVRRLD